MTIRRSVTKLLGHIRKQQLEIDRLRSDCAQAYQVIGAALLAPADPPDWTEDDVIRALDNLAAAANGGIRPHDDLLPWPKP